MRFDPAQGRCHPDAAPSASAFVAERPMPPHVDILGHPVSNLSRLGASASSRPICEIFYRAHDGLDRYIIYSNSYGGGCKSRALDFRVIARFFAR